MKRAARIAGVFGICALGLFLAWFLLAATAEPVVNGVNICDLCIETYSTDPKRSSAAKQQLQDIGYPAVQAVISSLENHHPHGTLPSKLGAVISGILQINRDQEFVGWMEKSEYRLAAGLSVLGIVQTNGAISAERLEKLIKLDRWEDICGCWARPLSQAFADIGEPSLPVLKRMLLRGGTSEWIAMDAAQSMGPIALPLLPEMQQRLSASRDQFQSKTAATALAGMGISGVEVLNGMLSSGNTGQKLAIAEALFRANQSFHAGEQLFSIVQTSVGPENEYGHEWPAIALATSGYQPDAAADLFAAGLASETEYDASYSLALRLLGDAGLRHLAKALGSDNERVRINAAYVLSCEVQRTGRRPSVLYGGWGAMNDVFDYHLPPSGKSSEAVAAFKFLVGNADPEIRSLADKAIQKWTVHDETLALALKPVLESSNVVDQGVGSQSEFTIP